MLLLPQLPSIRLDDEVLGETLLAIQQALNGGFEKLGVDPSPAPQNPQTSLQNFPAPRPPASLAVNAVTVSGSKIYAASIGASPDADDSIRYAIEFSTTPTFQAATAFLLGIQNFVGAMLLPAGTRYWRARCKFPESAWSPYVYFGTAANPTGV